MKEPTPYQAYLLRLWPTKRSGMADFRVSLESVDSGERQDFADLESMVAYLRAHGELRTNRGRHEKAI